MQCFALRSPSDACNIFAVLHCALLLVFSVPGTRMASVTVKMESDGGAAPVASSSSMLLRSIDVSICLNKSNLQEVVQDKLSLTRADETTPLHDLLVMRLKTKLKIKSIADLTAQFHIKAYTTGTCVKHTRLLDDTLALFTQQACPPGDALIVERFSTGRKNSRRSSGAEGSACLPSDGAGGTSAGAGAGAGGGGDSGAAHGAFRAFTPSSLPASGNASMANSATSSPSLPPTTSRSAPSGAVGSSPFSLSSQQHPQVTALVHSLQQQVVMLTALLQQASVSNQAAAPASASAPGPAAPGAPAGEEFAALFVIPMVEELAAFNNVVKECCGAFPALCVLDHFPFQQFTVRGAKCLVAAMDTMGTTNMATAVLRLLPDINVKRILEVGIGGAAHAGVKVGDVAVATDV